MSKIKVRNFGAIQDGFPQNDGFIDIPAITLFTGNQGSGKSTLAKLISTFAWMEKVLFRGDYEITYFLQEGVFQNTYLAYHRIENYLKENSTLEYIGKAYSFRYQNGKLSIDKNMTADYALPHILYIPADRNLISSVENPQKYKDISESLVAFLGEYSYAVNQLRMPVPLPIGADTFVEYDKQNQTIYIKGKDYHLKLLESSSGFQSIIPLYLTSLYIFNSLKDKKNGNAMSSAEEVHFSALTAEIIADTALTDKQKRIAISEIGKKFKKTIFVNIIEEPEQNLFPTAQWEILKQLLAFANNAPGSSLIMTTHSPYLIEYITIMIKAAAIKESIAAKEMEEALQRIVPLQSLVRQEDVAIYEFQESVGTINALDTPNGLPSDENQLNDALGETNELFAELLEFQQSLCG